MNSAGGVTMNKKSSNFEDYLQHLMQISFLGRIYKRFFSSPLLFICCRNFGSRIVEVGAGIGNGVLGAFPHKVAGIDINPLAVEYCKARGFNAQLIGDNGTYPFSDGSFDACILDNVLEHIDDPQKVLDECWRITASNGGLVIAVPGKRGFDSDSDHKIYYDELKLRELDNRWKLQRLFAMPSFFLSTRLSESMRQYCMVAIYVKN